MAPLVVRGAEETEVAPGRRNPVVEVKKMGMRLEKENVRIIFMILMNEMDHYGREGKDAEHQSSYIAGALDMANAVMDAIEKLGGK